MPNSLLIAVDGARCAEHIDAWLPVLVTAGFQRATLFHAVREEYQKVADSLDALRPLLDRLANTLSAHGIDTDVALKRGDVVKWLIALAEVRRSDLIVVALPAARGPMPEYLDELCAGAPIPVLVLPAGQPRNQGRLYARPLMVSGSDDAELAAAAGSLIHATLTTIAAKDITDVPDASMLVMGPAPSGKRLTETLGQAVCPVLLFPSRVLGVPARAT